MNTLIEKQIRDILEKLTEKRGKHSELWMWPKEESLNEATQAILAIAEKREKEAKYNERIKLMGLFHAVMNELYGKELADMVMAQVNKIYIHMSHAPIKEENKCK